ncbi:hypothetical protein Lal_00039940 [Lupinus albus]|nr:hypothetical protein Lal_00039940 [Lupinus albus]
MAPSSRSKRARNTNPLDLSRLLKDDEQQKGKHFALTLTEFGECLSLPSTGVMLGSFIECPWSGFNKREFYFSHCRFFEAEISRKRSGSAAGSSRETLGLETPFSIKEHRIDLTSLGKMQIVEAPDGSLRHKDQKVEDDAPLEAPAQPAPPTPQDLVSPFFRDELLAPVLHFVFVGRGERKQGGEYEAHEYKFCLGVKENSESALSMNKEGISNVTRNLTESSILAQEERWRNALHMQVRHEVVFPPVDR